MSLQTVVGPTLGVDAPNLPLTGLKIRQTDELQAFVRKLAALPESRSPVLSCYLDLESIKGRWELVLEHRARQLRRITPISELPYLDGAMEKARTFLKTGLRPQTRGVAIFARAGWDPYFSALQFEVPTPTWISLDKVPSIYHLVELKETYDRYLVLLSTSESGRIFEVHLGAVTRQLWVEQPELRQRVGREWTRLHYQNHRRDRDRSFVNEKVQVLERLMLEGRYAHLVLAGDPQRTAMIRRALPRVLQERVVDIVNAPAALTEKEVVEATLKSFIDEQERESQTLAQELVRELRCDGLAVSGAANCLQALRRGQADALILSRDWDPEDSWSCETCLWSVTGSTQPEVCADCGSSELRRHETREELVRLASQTGCRVEVVNDSAELRELDGVGCLLRYNDWSPAGGRGALGYPRPAS